MCVRCYLHLHAHILIKNMDMLKLFMSLCCKFIFQVSFSILSYDNAMIMFCLGLGTTNTWSGLENIMFCLKIPEIVVIKLSSSITLTNVEMLWLFIKIIQWFHAQRLKTVGISYTVFPPETPLPSPLSCNMKVTTGLES